MWKRGVVPVAEFGPAIGVVQIDDDVGGIEQHDQVLREIGDRVDMQVRVAQQHRAGLGDGEGRADDREIDIRQILRRADTGDVAVARDLRHRRAHDLGAGDLLADRRQDITRGGGSRNSPPMWCRLSLKAASSEAGGLSSNSGTSGSGRSTRGRFSRTEARISSRLLMVSLRDWPDTSCGRSVWAGAAPRGACPRR